MEIFTIGHGTRKAEEFIGLLRQYQIKNLVDVRSRPYSRFNPQFNLKALTALLEQNGIHFHFLGDKLGGRPSDQSFYVNGQISYDRIIQSPAFQEGLQELMTIPVNGRTAIMCSERKPEDCHRSTLIGRQLPPEIDIYHIDEAGQLKSQEDLGLLRL